VRAPKQIANAVEDVFVAEAPVSAKQVKVVGFGVMALCVIAQELREIREALSAIAERPEAQ
jgi:hypothetical protein